MVNNFYMFILCYHLLKMCLYILQDIANENDYKTLQKNNFAEKKTISEITILRSSSPTFSILEERNRKTIGNNNMQRKSFITQHSKQRISKISNVVNASEIVRWSQRIDKQLSLR